MWKTQQLVVSLSEPELGIGLIDKIDTQRNLLDVTFAQTGERRIFSVQSAQLRRFTRSPGQKARLATGEIVLIEAIIEKDGLFQYKFAESTYWEYELSFPNHQESQAIKAFEGGFATSPEAFELRTKARHIEKLQRSSPVAGFVGAKLNPLAHQLYVASELSSRERVRAVLADEVGLGKTIEAGLVFARLRAQARAGRVLLVVPESLINQWVFEMYNRFNELFAIFDPARLESEWDEEQVFDAAQKIIVSLESLSNEPHILAGILNTSWQLVIVDEAHHLRYGENEPNRQWLAVKTLGNQVDHLLLLTATPQIFGLENEFGLLNIVDESRFSDLHDFYLETKKGRKSASLAKKLRQNKLEPQDLLALEKLLSAHEVQKFTADPSPKQRKKLIQSLVDRHGTGRVLFRNRRARLSGFPTRNVVLCPLATPKIYWQEIADIDQSNDASLLDLACGIHFNRHAKNPKWDWLLNFLAAHQHEKTLIMCRLGKDAELVYKMLLKHLDKAKMSLFHEGLTPIERDIQAVHFLKEGGANILIASEIGGEGRNFQAAINLVFWDIPKLPNILEQRIGRLDRIGQGKAIFIYIPFLEKTPEEVFVRWYHQGFDAFATACSWANLILEEVVSSLLKNFSLALVEKTPEQIDKNLTKLLSKTQEFYKSQTKKQASLNDYLLDLNSFNEKKGLALKEQVFDCDDDVTLETFFKACLDYFGVDYMDLDANGSIVIEPDSLSFLDQIPGLSKEDAHSFVFDREIALVREEAYFVSYDHFITEGLIATLLAKGDGLFSLAQWQQSPYRGILVRLLFLIENTAPKFLAIDRFLSQNAFELNLLYDGKKVFLIPDNKLPTHDSLSSLSPEVLHKNPQLQQVVSSLIKKGETRAKEKFHEDLRGAKLKAKEILDHEVNRLEELAKFNPTVSKEELLLIRERRKKALHALDESQVVIDAIQVIYCQG